MLSWMPMKSCVWYFGFHDDQVKYIVFIGIFFLKFQSLRLGD